MADTRSEIAVKLAAEIVNGVDPKDSLVPDTAENRALRNSLKSEIDSMKSDGVGINLPSEWGGVPKTLPAKVDHKKAEKAVDLSDQITDLIGELGSLSERLGQIEKGREGG